MPLAYLNGKFIDSAEMLLPVSDAGFVQGVAVAEQIRTFRGRLFRLEDHLARLQRSLEIVGISPAESSERIGEIAERVAAENHALLDPADDIGLSLFVTPGLYATFSATRSRSNSRGEASEIKPPEPTQPPKPTVGVHAYPIPFRQWSGKYEEGESLTIVEFRQVPNDCWPAALKCRSRMHYFLADRRARAIDPASRALLLDLQGNASEASTASVLAYFAGEGIVSPPKEKVLPGVSAAVLAELASAAGIPWSHRELSPEELASADEVFLCSTSPCILPVVRLNGRPIADGAPGGIFRRLLAAWSDLVGCDVAAQAKRFAT